MKNVLFIACFAMFFALSMGSCVYAASAEMTADELIATTNNNTITLTEDVTLTTNLVVPSDVKVIDLGGKTLTLKGCLGNKQANPIMVNSVLEIKNGTIERYVAQNSSEKSLVKGSIIVVSGSDANLTLNEVTLDGKNLDVTMRTDVGAHALYIVQGASVTANDSKLINNKVVYNPSIHSSTLYARGAKNVILNNTEVSNNSNEDHTRGGIVWVKETEKFEINNSVISDNTILGSSIVSVDACGTFTFAADSIVKNNKAGEASGIHVTNTNATIAGTIEGNETTKSDGNGGGLYTFLSDATKTVTITETAVIKNNIAGGAGGGVYVNGDKVNAATGNVIMNGGLITGNTAKGTPNETTLKDGGGAGVYVARGTMTINDGTIENNTSTSGVGNGILVSHAGGNTEAGKLEINGGYVDGEIALAETYGDVEVTGGAFTDDIADYLATGLTEVEVDGIYYVGTPMKVNIKEVKNGTVTTSAETAVEGQPVKITATAKEGYELDTIKVTDASGKEVTVSDNAFTMPATEVTVEVTFKALALDNTPATGSMDTLLFASVIVAAVAIVAIARKKQAMKNLV